MNGEPIGAFEAWAQRGTVSPLDPTVTSSIAVFLQGLTFKLLTLYIDAKLAHWNVAGQLRVPLHALFDEVASAASSGTDSAAERLRQLGAYVAPEQVSPSVSGSDGLELCRAIGSRIEEVLAALQEVKLAANAAGDNDTLDILTDVSRALEKHGADVIAHLSGT